MPITVQPILPIRGSGPQEWSRARALVQSAKYPVPTTSPKNGQNSFRVIYENRYPHPSHLPGLRLQSYHRRRSKSDKITFYFLDLISFAREHCHFRTRARSQAKNFIHMHMCESNMGWRLFGEIMAAAVLLLFSRATSNYQKIIITLITIIKPHFEAQVWGKARGPTNRAHMGRECRSTSGGVSKLWDVNKLTLGAHNRWLSRWIWAVARHREIATEG